MNRSVKTILIAFLVLALSVTLFGCAGTTDGTENTSAAADSAVSDSDVTASAAQEGALDYLVLVNKQNALPDGWEDAVEIVETENRYGEPYQVEKAALAAFEDLQKDLLDNDGIIVELDSTYRSVQRQQEIWSEYEAEKGVEYARQYVAVPGYSEHHTGLAIDVSIEKDGVRIEDNDGMLAEPEIFAQIHKRLADHGFILRYPEGKKDITGYAYSPWAIRYVGSADVAKEIMDKGITLEEYLGKVPDTAAKIDYGSSDLYTEDEMTDAVNKVKAAFFAMGDNELKNVRYAGDECNTEENIALANSLQEGAGFTQVIEFLTDFHSAADGESTLNPDFDYTDWQWWLARTDGGDWMIVSNGYG